MMQFDNRRSGFTLIELLVVVAVIAVLIGILLPALGGARRSAWNGVCQNHMRSIAQACTTYTSDSQYYPPSYVYGSKETGSTWNMGRQGDSNPVPANGYVHFSYSLFDGDDTADEAFQCPAVEDGGAPATNPGPNVADWESWQQNDLGGGPGATSPRDRQARRMAYTGNAAIFPRNKFPLVDLNGVEINEQRRKNRLVVAARVINPANTILAAEFFASESWLSIAASGDSSISKSHRPITPFLGGSAGYDVFSEPVRDRVSFFYPNESKIKKIKDLNDPRGLIDGSAETAMNAIGRHHPGGDSEYGGSANYVFADGHVSNIKSIIDTIRGRNWGEEFYSLNKGNNKISKEPFGGTP